MKTEQPDVLDLVIGLAVNIVKIIIFGAIAIDLIFN